MNKEEIERDEKHLIGRNKLMAHFREQIENGLSFSALETEIDIAFNKVKREVLGEQPVPEEMSLEELEQSFPTYDDE